MDTPALPSIDAIIDDFAFLDEWEDRYRYLIELGRQLPPLAAEAHSDANKVQGCARPAMDRGSTSRATVTR